MAQNRRIQKKQHVGEFTHYGFEVHFEVGQSWSTPEMDALYDRFILEAIEYNGLSCGGGANDNGNTFAAHFFVEKIRPQAKFPWKFVGASASEDDRKNVETWLKAQKDIISFEVSPLLDAWN